MEKNRHKPKEDPFHTGDKLKKLRTKEFWTQEYGATQLGVKPNTLSNYELGTLIPPRVVLEKAAVLFKVDIREFFTTDRFTLNFHGKTVGSGYIENQHLNAVEAMDWMKGMMDKMDEQRSRSEQRIETLMEGMLALLKNTKRRG